jgi:hypothetical protein
MSFSNSPSDIPPESPAARSGGVDVRGGQTEVGRDLAGRDIQTAGHDIVGRDVVTVTQTGFSELAVQRLVITVGVLVFVTAAFFFAGGIIVGGVFANLNKPVGSSQQAARDMQDKLDTLSRLRPGQRFIASFSEDEISSYIRFIAGPQLGLNNAKARLLSGPGRIVLEGNYAGLSNAHVIVIIRLALNDQPTQVESAAVQVLPTGNSTFGWVFIPPPLVQPLASQIDARVFSQARLNAVQVTTPTGPETQPAVLTVAGVGK